MTREFLKPLKKVTAKRAKTVIDHIIKHGQITTEELKALYDYNHPPRAARDVREQGIPLETFSTKDKTGKSISGYRFGNPDKVEGHKLGGRKIFSKAFKAVLVKAYGAKCAISNETYEERYLQIDHRLPYEVVGDAAGTERQPEHFMLLSGSAQRQKSWSCEHCINFTVKKDPKVCKGCYWAYPEKYSHVAMREERRVDLTFSGAETKVYDELKKNAQNAGSTIQDFIKQILK